MALKVFTYHSLADLWPSVLAPWLSEHGIIGPPGAGEAVVLAPDAVRLGEIKRTWLEQGGGPVFGVRFWTPGLLRRYLLEHHFPSRRVATAEDLALAVRLAAGDSEEEESPVGVVARDPRGFLAAWDAWLAAGAGNELIAAPWRPLVARLETLLNENQLVSARTADWQLASLPESETPPLRALLIDGFSPAHAAFFPLLQAAIRQAGNAVCTVPMPHARRLEQVWLGTLEAMTSVSSETAPPASKDEGSFADWARAAEAGMTGHVSAATDFHLFSERRFEVSAVAARARAILADEPSARIGIALPEEPLLRRAVAGELVGHGFPVHDSFGHFPIATALERLFGAWVEYQRRGQLPDVQVFVEALVGAGRLKAESADRLFRTWSRAREMTGSDDLATLTAYLRIDPAAAPGAAGAADWAARWPRLDEGASLAYYLDRTRDAFAYWHDDARFEEALARWEDTWLRQSPRLRRGLFLDWLFASLRVPGRARHPAARDAFAPIQLVGYEAIRGGQWTHLLLAGLNEGLVPPPGRENAYLVAEASRRHMCSAAVAGSQGEGHETLRPGTGFLLDETDRRSVLAGNLFDAIADTTSGVECFATYAPEGRDRKATVLSEVFTALYRAARGDAPLPPVRTAEEEGLPARSIRNFPPVQAMAEAYARRCDPEQPFDEYTFGFKSPPEMPIELGARDWEALLARPAAVWLSAIARVRPMVDFNVPIGAGLVLGSAVHRLLRLPATPAWRPIEELAKEWEGGLAAEAHAWRQAVEEAHAIAGRSLPAAWREQWGGALRLARSLLRATLCADAGNWLASEYSLPEEARIAVDGGLYLRLRGRVDAILVDDPDNPKRALVIDFKTGADQPLTPRRAQRGEGLQLVLYGGALAEAWRVPVDLCLLKSGGRPDPQLEIEPGSDPSERLAGLAELGSRGVFGFGGTVRSAFRYVGEYPLAFLPPPSEIAEAKWQLTHPELPLPEGTTE